MIPISSAVYQAPPVARGARALGEAPPSHGWVSPSRLVNLDVNGNHIIKWYIYELDEIDIVVEDLIIIDSTQTIDKRKQNLRSTLLKERDLTGAVLTEGPGGGLASLQRSAAAPHGARAGSLHQVLPNPSPEPLSPEIRNPEH